jgi:hypothetical protein
MPGVCTRNYVNISKDNIDNMFNVLLSYGAVITGNNPWYIETCHHGVILRAEWNEVASTLTVSITGRNWYVPHDIIWSNVDSFMFHRDCR